MKARCGNPKNKQWKNYGGRGIIVCERWIKFEEFIFDMGLKPTKKHTLDRSDNSLGYSKENCRWVVNKVQCNNKRNNIHVEWMGRKWRIYELEKQYGIPHRRIYTRLRLGWPVSRAISEPVYVRPIKIKS